MNSEEKFVKIELIQELNEIYSAQIMTSMFCYYKPKIILTAKVSNRNLASNDGLFNTSPLLMSFSNTSPCSCNNFCLSNSLNDSNVFLLIIVPYIPTVSFCSSYSLQKWINDENNIISLKGKQTVMWIVCYNILH